MLKIIDEHFEEAIVVALMALMSILIGVQIFMRYVMGASLSWSEELSRYFFVWLTFLGAVLTFRENSHMGIETLVMFLSRRALAPALPSLHPPLFPCPQPPLPPLHP